MADRSPQAEVREEVFRTLMPPAEMRDQILEQTRSAMQRNFDGSFTSPGGYRLELVGDIELGRIPEPDDFEKQYEAVSRGRTFGVPATGLFRVTDPKGEVLLESRRKIAEIPVPDMNRAFIVDGKRRFLLSQWRRKPGIYTRRTNKDEIVSEFNVDPSTESKVRPFKIKLDRSADGEKTQFRFVYGSSEKVDMWSIAKMLGAKDEELKKAVGDKIASSVLDNHSDKQYQKDLRKVHKSVFGESAKGRPIKELETELRDQFDGKSYLDPDVNRLHLGKDYQTVNKNSVLSSFRRMMEVSRGGDPDDRESLATKMFLSPADLIAESVGRPSTIQRYQRGVEGRMRQLDKPNVQPKIDLLLKDTIRSAIKNRLKNSDLQRTEGITTPLDAMSQATATTIVGEGAIASDKQVPDEAKLLNPTGTGYLDLVHSPESARSGVVLHTTARAKTIPGAQKGLKARDMPTSRLVTPFRKPNGSIVDIDPYGTANKIIAAFDQYTMDGSKLVPKPNEQGLVRAFRNGKVVLVSPDEVDYYQKDAQALFDPNTSLVPFVSSTQGNRIGYAAKQMNQSLPLKYREEPLVQVGLEDHDMSVEQVLGEEAGARIAPFDGTVVRIEEGRAERRLVVKKKGGRKEHVIRLPKEMPTGGKTIIDSELLVKEGDTFERGQALADSTFTRNGTLAPGVNLNVAYLPYLDGTFEDAIVVSESAAKKLTSEHLYKERLGGRSQIFGLKRFQANARMPLTDEQAAKLDEDGIIQEGQTIMPNDPFAVHMHEIDLSDKALAKQLAKIGAFGSTNRSQKEIGHYAIRRTWDKGVPGVVTRVEKIKNSAGEIKDVKIYVRTEEELQAGDKLFGRYGNKGIVSHVLPDVEMPRTKDGQHMEVLLSPLGVIGRQNPSQNFETYLAKVADKIGKPEIVHTWRNESNWDFVKKKLDEHAVKDSEDLLDPVTKKILPSVGFGKQYILKAKQQVDKKTNARGIGAFRVDSQVSKGKDSAQTIGELGVYGLLAQDAREVLRDAQLYKSEDRADVWAALENGEPLPHPDIPASFNNFLAHLRGAGIDVEEDAKEHGYRLLPQTDESIRKLARTGTEDNVIKDMRGTIRAVDGKPTPGGLFDPRITGDSGSDSRFARYELSRRLPNPTFEKAIQDVLDIRPKTFKAIMAGEQGVRTSDGTELYNSAALEHLLKTTDLDKRYEDSLESLRKLASNKKKSASADRSRALRTLRTVQMLRRNQMRPEDAFMRQNVLVAPTRVRGLREDQKTGDLMIGDLNFLYRDIGLIDHELRRAEGKKSMPPKAIAQLEDGLYQGLRALNQVEGSEPTQGGSSAFQGLLGALAGIPAPVRGQKTKADPGESLFKKNLLERRQIMSGRAVLASDSKLHMDEVSVPRPVAISILEPKILGEWNRSYRGLSTRDRNAKRDEFKDALRAYKNEGKRDKEVDRMLERVTENQYVVVKRDPVLHKYGTQGFKLRLGPEKQNTLNLHPVVFGGFGADSVLGDIWIREDQQLSVVDIAAFPRTDLIRETDRVKVYAVPDGIEVPTYVDGSMTYVPVSEFSIHSDCVEWEVELSDKQVIQMAETHSVAAFSLHGAGIESVDAIEAEGRWIPSIRYLPPGEGAEWPVPNLPSGRGRFVALLDDWHQGWWVGAVIGDGWVSNNEYTCLSYGADGEDVASFWEDLSLQICPGASVHTQDMPHEFEGVECLSFRKTLCSVETSRWLKPLIGSGSYDKHLPDFALSLSESARLGLFCGLLDTDGCISLSKKGQYVTTYETQSYQLAEDVKRLASTLCIYSRISESFRKGRPEYTVVFSARDIWLRKDIRLIDPKKMGRLREFQSLPEPNLDQKDRVPINEHIRQELLSELLRLGAGRRNPNKNLPAFASYVVLRKNQTSIPRTQVERLRELVEPTSLIERWFQLVEDMSVRWEKVVRSEPTGRCVEMYDLKVPGPYTFTMASGATVYDSDGDTLAVYAPIHKRANTEIKQKLLPSKNLFNPSSGQLEFNLSHEAILGISRATRKPDASRRHEFGSFSKAKDAYLSNQVKIGDTVTIMGITRSFGEHWVNSELPPGMKLDDLAKVNVNGKPLIGGLGTSTGMDKGDISSIMTYIAQKAPQDFPGVARGLRILGEEATTYEGVTLRMKDLKPVLREDRKAAERDLFKELKSVTEKDPEARDRVVKGIFSRVLAPLQERADEHLKDLARGDDPNVASELTWTRARVKPNQLRQVLLAPQAVTDAQNRITEAPIMDSYSEGLDVTGYVSAAHGVRQGLISKVVSVEQPGYLNKQVVNTAMDYTITENDCGTSRGVPVNLTDNHVDLDGRVLARTVKVGSRIFQKNSVLSSNDVNLLRTKAKDLAQPVLVRSPLKCQADHGICQKCAGKNPDGKYPDIGTNIGIQSAQALGERSTQLMLSLFHDGGVFDPKKYQSNQGGHIQDVFKQASALLRMPSTMYGQKADISRFNGVVQGVDKDEDTGDFQLRLKDKDGTDRSIRLSNVKGAPDGSSFQDYFQKGMELRRGDVLTTGVASPIEILRETRNIDTARGYMVDKLNSLYGPHGVRRRNIETVVRSITGTVEVTTPSTSGLPPGTRIPVNEAEKIKIKHPGFKYRSIILGVDTAPREIRDDWMSQINYNNIRRSLIQSASTGAFSSIHSTNPIPALAVAKEFNRFPRTALSRNDGRY